MDGSGDPADLGSHRSHGPAPVGAVDKPDRHEGPAGTRGAARADGTAAGSPEHGSRRVRVLDRTLRILLPAGVIVALVFALDGLDLDRLWSAVTDAEPVWLIIGVLANVVSQTARALGWNVMLAGRPIRFSRLLRIEFAAQAAAAVTPEGAGELLRVGYLFHEGIPRTVTLTIMFVRKFFSNAGLVPFLVVIWWPGSGAPTWAVVTAWVYTAVLAVEASVILIAARTPATPARQTRLRRLVFDARRALRPVRRPRAVAEVTGAVLLTRSCDLLALFAVAQALDLDLPWAVAVLVLLALEFAMILPTAPAQVGTFEAAVLIATAGAFGQVDGLALALVFHAQQMLPQIPIGMAAMLEGRIVRDRSKGDSR